MNVQHLFEPRGEWIAFRKEVRLWPEWRLDRKSTGRVVATTRVPGPATIIVARVAH